MQESSPMEPADRIQILIVDDHPVVRMGVAAIIQSSADMSVVAQAGTGEEAIRLFEMYRPDITLMDLRLPGMSGVETIRTIRRSHPSSCFVVLTTYEGDEDIYQALAAGARSYIIKGMPHEALLGGLRRVHAGGRYLPQAVSRTLASRTPSSELSARERKVLDLMATGMRNREIAAELGITEGTVKCHVSVILTRLNASDRTQAVMTALQRGLVHL